MGRKVSITIVAEIPCTCRDCRFRANTGFHNEIYCVIEPHQAKITCPQPKWCPILNGQEIKEKNDNEES